MRYPIGRTLASLAILAALAWATNQTLHRLMAGTPAIDVLHSLYLAPSWTMQPGLPMQVATIILVIGLILIARTFWAARYRRDGHEHGTARWAYPTTLWPLAAWRKHNNILLGRWPRTRISIPRKRFQRHQRNTNTCHIGIAGAGKTRNIVIPNLLNPTGCSYLVTDPKGELLRQTGTWFDSRGYRIRVLNLVTPTESDSINLLAYLRPGREPEDIDLLIRNFIANTRERQQAGGGDAQFFELAERQFLAALTAFVYATHPPADRHMGTVIDMLMQARATEATDQPDPVTQLMDAARTQLATPTTIEHRDVLQYAVDQYTGYQQAARRTAASVLVSCAVRLGPLNIPNIRTLITTDTLQLDQVGHEKTILYLVIPDTNSQFSWLASTVFTTFFQQAVWDADQQPDGRLPIPVQCWMDEFANIGRIPDYGRTSATLRGRGISCHHIIHTINQPKRLYHDDWDIIRGNCDTLTCLGTTDPDTMKWFATQAGKQTIRARKHSRQKPFTPPTRSEDPIVRDLITPDEIGKMRPTRILIIIRGIPAIRARKLRPRRTPTHLYHHTPIRSIL